MEKIAETVQSLMKKMEPEFFDIFQHCHEYPELSLKEYETTKYIKEILTSLDIEILEIDNLETGVVGLLKGKKAGPCIGLRADIDGLPILEESSSPYPSLHPGVMHACGHDTHYASLLCAAKILSQMREHLQGSVKFLFQPAEEINLGAKMMVRLGCLENPHVDAIFGMHNSPEIPLGTVAVKDGPLMAGVDRINLTIKGKGGHGGIPQNNADPIVAAAAIIQSLQTIVSRNISPLHAAVVSVCNVQAGHGTTNNVCPDEVKMYGTVRTYKQEHKYFMDRRIREIVEGIATAYRTEGISEYIYELPVTDNTRRPGWPNLLKIANEAVIGAGAEPIDPEASGGGEDFSIFVEGFEGHAGVPGFFYWLGVRNEKDDCIYSWHSPHFKANAECIPIGAGVYALSALYACQQISASQRNNQNA